MAFKLTFFIIVALQVYAASCCEDHDACDLGEYCTDLKQCADASGCLEASNSIDDSCPSTGLACAEHSDCNQDSQYCDANGQCFVCAACFVVNDAIDSKCPSWCSAPATTTTSSGSAGQSQNTVQNTGSNSGSGKKDNSAAVAAGVSTALVLMALILVVMFIYYRRQDKKQPLEKEGVRLRDVLTLQQAADHAVRRMSQSTIALKKERKSKTQEELMYDDEFGGMSSGDVAPVKRSAPAPPQANDPKIEMVRTFSLDYRELAPMINEAKAARQAKKLLEQADEIGHETCTDAVVDMEDAHHSQDGQQQGSSGQSQAGSGQSEDFPTSLSLLGWPSKQRPEGQEDQEDQHDAQYDPRAASDESRSTGEGITIEWEDDMEFSDDGDIEGVVVQRGETSL